MALNAHGYRRTTGDVDLLMTPRGFEDFCDKFVDKIYERVAGRSRRFVECKSGVTIDIILTGHYPGSGKPGPIPFPDPRKASEDIDDYRVVNLRTLVELKLAAGAGAISRTLSS